MAVPTEIGTAANQLMILHSTKYEGKTMPKQEKVGGAQTL
jgi:hypothetical protein